MSSPTEKPFAPALGGEGGLAWKYRIWPAEEWGTNPTEPRPGSAFPFGSGRAECDFDDQGAERSGGLARPPITVDGNASIGGTHD